MLSICFKCLIDLSFISIGFQCECMHTIQKNLENSQQHHKSRSFEFEGFILNTTYIYYHFKYNIHGQVFNSLYPNHKESSCSFTISWMNCILHHYMKFINLAMPLNKWLWLGLMASNCFTSLQNLRFKPQMPHSTHTIVGMHLVVYGECSLVHMRWPFTLSSLRIMNIYIFV